VTLIYNLVMLVVDVAAVWLLSRRRGLLVWCCAMALAGGVAAGLAIFLAHCTEEAQGFASHFAIFRLWSYGVFLHGVALLIATAVLWRRDRLWMACGAVLAAIVTLLAGADAFLIEPHWLEVSHYQIASRKIRRPLRIVVVADLQTDNFGQYERDVLRQALAEKPDLILLAGDCFQATWLQEMSLRAELQRFFREVHFKAPLGVFAVRGNVDPSDLRGLFKGSDVTAVATGRSIDLRELQLTCLGLRDSFDTQLKVTSADLDKFHLVLGHVPNFALGNMEADLLVAGHTHGGQVRIPWIGPLITHSAIPNAWAAGLTDLPGGVKLLVSRGIGMERGNAPRMRFLCRPELVVIELTPEKKRSADERR
jgi:uncharacterized protein